MSKLHRILLYSTSAYSIRAVAESLGHLLKQGLQYHPQHLAWIRLSGDYEFVCDNNEAAMAHYVAVLLTGTEYCTLHLQQRQLLDDHMTRRMIKASLNLGCNIQAAILCQLLDDIDYGLAFKCIAERTTFKNIGDKAAHYCDAMDAYYGCVWDATLLEYIIQQHCRKGEHKRKQQTVSTCLIAENNTIACAFSSNFIFFGCRHTDRSHLSTGAERQQQRGDQTGGRLHTANALSARSGQAVHVIIVLFAQIHSFAQQFLFIGNLCFLGNCRRCVCAERQRPQAHPNGQQNLQHHIEDPIPVNH